MNARTESLVTDRGLAPEAFIDGVEVVPEGRPWRGATFRASTAWVTCAARYENAPDPDEYRESREVPPTPAGAGA